MIYLPDTNVFSAYLAGRSEPLAERMRTEGGKPGRGTAGEATVVRRKPRFRFA